MQRLRIQHLTEYLFPTQVTLNQHRLLLRPREGHDVRIETSRLEITPTPHIKWQRDVFDNSLAVVTFSGRSDKLVIASDVVIQHFEQAPFDFLVDDYALYYPFSYAVGEQVDLAAFQRLVFFNDQQEISILRQSRGFSPINKQLVAAVRVIRHGDFWLAGEVESGDQQPVSLSSERRARCPVTRADAGPAQWILPRLRHAFH